MKPQVKPWPSFGEIKEERNYGTPGPAAGDYVPPQLTVPEVIRGYKDNSAFDAKPSPDRRLPDSEADRLYAAKMSANQQPVAALGFDVNRMVVTPGNVPLSLFGAYHPDKDKIWSNGASGTNPVHESIHRAIKKMGDNGFDFGGLDEEVLTRALMLRHYGPVERGKGADGNAQVDAAAAALKDPKSLLNKMLPEIEKRAAHMGATELLRGSPDTGYDRR